jgi:BRCT domain type II-containing protein
VGSDPGASKVTKAQELGIKIIGSEKFGALLESGTHS